MSASLRVFRIVDGAVTTALPIQNSLHQVAREAYAAVRAGRPPPSQNRVEEMISCCLDIVQRAIDGDESIPPMLFEEDSEVEMLTDYLFRCDANGFFFAELITQGSELTPPQLLAAYALHRTDAAAHAVHMGDLPSAIESLALGCQATADYAFHTGFNDYPEMLKYDGGVHAKSSARVRGSHKTKEYVAARWIEANTTSKPKSQRWFAKHITPDVMAFALQHGWKMSQDNALRIISEWIAAEVKRSRPES